MSLTQCAFLKKTEVPSRKKWQKAIDKLGYALELDARFKPCESSGFVPCQLNKFESGFEIDYEEITDYLKENPEFKRNIGIRDYCITFRWSTSMTEGLCISIVSLALVELCDAIIYFEDDDSILEKSDLKANIQGFLEELKKQG